MVWRKTHACSINESIMAQVNLAIYTRFLNHQIKITVNILDYTVFSDRHADYFTICRGLDMYIELEMSS